MDIHILDRNTLRRIDVLDDYLSLIWTERFAETGDFELEVYDTRSMRNRLASGSYLSQAKSKYVMVVETSENKVDDEGRQILHIEGRTLELLLDDRVAMPSFAGLATSSKWTIGQKPKDAANYIFDTIIRSATLDSGDSIPHLSAGTHYDLGNTPAYPDAVSFELDPDTVYNSIKKICDVYGLGFRLVRAEIDPANPVLFFEVYMGSDRTSGQTILPAVIFDQELENLSNVTELNSTQGFKNVAYVYGHNGSMIVYGDGVDPTVSGADRHVLLVQADDITLAAGNDLNAALTQKGREELAKYRQTMALDGEIPKTSSYEYNVDYFMGDVLEVRGSGGLANNMQVTEQIFTSDENGEGSYPTLSLVQTISPESWLAWGGERNWNDLPDEDLWSTI